jgi:RHS repeat-associated protein
MPAGGGYSSPVNSMAVSEIIGALAGTALISSKGVTGSQISGQTGFPTTVNGLIGNQPAQTSATPKAGINWIVLDEQFKYFRGGFDMVGTAVNSAGTFKIHDASTIPTIPIPKNGYIYVYCNNESQYDVFFDNLQLMHAHGPILEETHYYPFGLTMAGISSKALSFGGAENKYKYNKGSELQSKEFSDGSGLELYATNFRSLDPQLGRWWQIDPKPDYAESPYSAMGNNPILRNDPLGDTTRGVNLISAQRELSIIRNSFKGGNAQATRNLFQLNGRTFKNINDKAFNKATAGLTPDQKALAKGYKEVINSEAVHNVEVVKQKEQLSSLSQKTFGYTDGADVNKLSGGGISTFITGDTKNAARLEVIVMDATSQVGMVGADGTICTSPGSAGEISAHEILGHQLASIHNSVSDNLNSIQAGNLYLRTQGITDFRNSHLGVDSFDSEKANEIPFYLKP